MQTKTKPDAVGDGFMTVDEVAEYLSLSRTTIYQMLERGQLPSAKFGRMRRIPRKAVVEYANKLLSATEEHP